MAYPSSRICLAYVLCVCMSLDSYAELLGQVLNSSGKGSGTEALCSLCARHLERCGDCVVPMLSLLRFWWLILALPAVAVRWQRENSTGFFLEAGYFHERDRLRSPRAWMDATWPHFIPPQVSILDAGWGLFSSEIHVRHRPRDGELCRDCQSWKI